MYQVSSEAIFLFVNCSAVRSGVGDDGNHFFSLFPSSQTNWIFFIKATGNVRNICSSFLGFFSTNSFEWLIFPGLSTWKQDLLEKKSKISMTHKTCARRTTIENHKVWKIFSFSPSVKREDTSASKRPLKSLKKGGITTLLARKFICEKNFQEVFEKFKLAFLIILNFSSSADATDRNFS